PLSAGDSASPHRILVICWPDDIIQLPIGICERTDVAEDESKTDLPPNKASPVELKGLIQLARTAYDQKRRKECLALTKAILKIDPASNEARVLQSLIESDINQALQRINALVKNPRMKNDEELRTNAYQMLQSVLQIDPDNKAANALLPEVDPGAVRDPAA